MIIEEEITKFKDQINKKYRDSENNFIYLRLSTLNKDLKDKDEQIKEALYKLNGDFLKLLEVYPNLREEGFKLFVEIKSAYKDIVREEFINLYSNYLFNDIKNVRHILEHKVIKDKKNLYITSYDRLSRQFFYFLNFQLIRIMRGINIFTLLSDEIDFENKNKNILDSDPNQQLLFVIGLAMFSNVSNKHSMDLSNKIKRRVDKDGKKTISNKTGKVWGRETTISNDMKKRIKQRFNKFSAKEIQEQSDIYQIINNKKQPISLHTIRKIVINK